MPLNVDKLDPERRYGVVIAGITEQDLKDASVRDELQKLWVEHGLILFRTKVSPEFHVELSQVFGPLEAHPVKEYQVPGNPLLLNAAYDPAESEIWSVDGEELGSWKPWHSDLIFLPDINHGGILRAHLVAAKGGGTAFIDQMEAYDLLPPDIKDRIETVDVVYKLRIDLREQKFVLQLNDVKLARTHQSLIENVRHREDNDFPPVVHPLVYVQPETGRRSLNLSPTHLEYIYGMDPEESDRLLGYLCRHITDPKLAYTQMWKSQDEMVLWDNWRVLHKALGCPPDVKRVMYRTTIAGKTKGVTLKDYEAARKRHAMAVA